MGQSPQRGPGAEPLVMGSEGRSPLLAKNRKFCLFPSHLAPSFGVTIYGFMEKLYGS